MRFHRRLQKSEGDVDRVMGLSNGSTVLYPDAAEIKTAMVLAPKSSCREVMAADAKTLAHEFCWTKHSIVLSHNGHAHATARLLSKCPQWNIVERGMKVSPFRGLGKGVWLYGSR